MDVKELEERYRQKRYDLYDHGDLNIKHLLGHRTFNRILVRLIGIQRVFNRQKLIIVNDKHHNNGKTMIFSPTHIGGVDVEMAFAGVHEPAWLMLADPREMYCNFSGAMLRLNGVIVFDADQKKDRYIAKMRSIELLKRGANMIIFSEGAYNISPNRLLMYPYVGTAEIAMETGLDIVPVALVRNGNDYYMNIGKNIDVSNNTADEKYELTDKLRETLAELVWEIVEQLPITKRRDLRSDYYDSVFLKEMFADNGDYTYTVEDVKNTLLKPKHIVEYEDAFSFMHTLNPKKENAFLFR